MQEWFVLQDNEKVGPMEFEKILQKLQSKELFAFDYVWTPGLDSWTPIADIPEFSETRMAKLVTQKDQSQFFSQRKSPRLETSIEIMFHKDHLFGYGLLDSISEGGAQLQIENPTLIPTSTIFVHCRGLDSMIQPFNCEFLITNKSFSRYRIQHRSKLHYSGAFAKIPIHALEQIRSMIEQRKSQGG